MVHLLIILQSVIFVAFPDASTRRIMYRSSAAEKRDTAAQGNIPCETNRHLIAFHYHGHLHLTAGIDQHFLQFFRVFVDIDIYCPVTVGFPSLIAKWSGVCYVDDYFIFHVFAP